MRARVASALTVLIASVTLVRGAGAQVLAGTVRDSVSRLPVPGVIVMLLDSAGGTLARNLTNERGEYRVAYRDFTRAARFVRIGFSPTELPVPDRAGATTPLDATMLRLPSLIRPIRVLANSRCRPRKDRADALGLWEQARAGLLATVVAREENPAKIVRLGFDKIMDGNSDRIERMRVRVDSADAEAASFVAAHIAQDFVRFGFSTDSAASGTYFGPDADVLLNEAFAGAYCFDLAGGGRRRPGQVGLHFLPSDRRRGRVDIDGTLWIDTVARELRDVEYRYLNVEAGAERFHPGGRVSFRSMKNGVVFIDRWSIRVVSATPDTIVDMQGNLKRRDWLYAEEEGGELASVAWPDGAAWAAPLGALRVQAVNENGSPAAGAVVALEATPYFGVANSRGQVEIRNLFPGPYRARIIDPRVAPLGIGLPTSLRFVAARDTTSVARLVIPSAKSYTLDRCRAAGQKLNYNTTSGSAFAILGRVVTPDGKPVAGAKVTVASVMVTPQPDGSNLLWLKDYWVTGSDGLFQACHNWDLKNEVVVRVDRFEADDVDVPAQFASDLLVLRVVAP